MTWRLRSAEKRTATNLSRARANLATALESIIDAAVDGDLHAVEDALAAAVAAETAITSLERVSFDIEEELQNV